MFTLSSIGGSVPTSDLHDFDIQFHIIVYHLTISIELIPIAITHMSPQRLTYTCMCEHDGCLIHVHWCMWPMHMVTVITTDLHVYIHELDSSTEIHPLFFQTFLCFFISGYTCIFLISRFYSAPSSKSARSSTISPPRRCLTTLLTTTSSAGWLTF